MKRQKGFTLIELLIVVAIIGIIAAIAIPNLLNAINRGRQKRTMADIRSIATAIESYSVDYNFYPRQGDGVIGDITPFVVPTYIKKMPDADGWNNGIQWYGLDTGVSYTVFSYGKGGGADTAWINGRTTDFASDIVYAEGQFYQWPEGMQIN